ncbi:MAG: LPS export ABC transporter periplasmic protein LptC [Rhodospirillaceae bacterium]|nr:LPS export ABC transporter periplasmic protein LptC [Rhodospirillaceae bacterium]
MSEQFLSRTNGDRASTIRSRRRYSRFVTLMRITLPLTAGAIIALVIAWPQLSHKPKSYRLGVSKITNQHAGEQQIINPRFSSTDSKQQPFNLTSDRAYRQKGNSNLINLISPKGDLTSKSGSWIALSAKFGLYDRNGEVLNLRDSVRLFHDSGYELRTTIAKIDLTEGTVMGDKPISGHGPGGKVQAEGFRIHEHGRIMVFTGKSRMVFYSKQKRREAR